MPQPRGATWNQFVQREPARRRRRTAAESADLDPKNAQTWYLLGASLVYKMTTKKVGDREVVQFAPGTIEAYQKAVELDPTGRGASRPSKGSNSCS